MNLIPMSLIPDPPQDQLLLLLAGRGGGRPVLRELIARFALRGPLVVLDGGNGFDAYGLARMIRRKTPEVETVLRRIWLARAFTCYQVLALLRGALPDRQPKVVMDLLATFQDDSVSPVDKDFLLQESLDLLVQLSRSAPVVVSVHPPTGPVPEFNHMLDRVREAASALVVHEEPAGPYQPRLF
jgi:hypothetical protein